MRGKQGRNSQSASVGLLKKVFSCHPGCFFVVILNVFCVVILSEAKDLTPEAISPNNFRFFVPMNRDSE